ncbi:RNA polymerase sigma factor [Eisenbergiella sp.]
MNQAKESKTQNFISVYKNHIDEIYQYVLLRTGFDVPLAEDITQDIFLDVFKGLRSFKGLCSERTWIFKIAKNKLFDYYRKQYSQKSEILALDDQMADELSDPKQSIEEHLQVTFESQQVRECLSQLPQQYRILLLLKYVEEISVKEIAQIIDKSPKSVESMLQRAKGAFIKQYQEKEGLQSGKEQRPAEKRIRRAERD